MEKMEKMEKKCVYRGALKRISRIVPPWRLAAAAWAA